MTHRDTCGKPRDRWESESDDGFYCSESCRGNSPGELGDRIERAILELVESRGPGKTICPSEVARWLEDDEWRELMEDVRRAAGRLQARGEVVVTRGGKRVDPWNPGGPNRIGR